MLAPLTDMTTHTPLPDALDQFVDELLACGAVLSQIIGHMVRFEAEGKSAPDAAPIPEVARELITGVLTDLKHHYSRRDLKVAARMVKEATDAMCSDIFMVDPDELENLDAE